MDVLNVQEVNVEMDQKKLLKNIQFSITEGKITALVGHNGAGKSTLMKTLMGVHQKSSGDITLLGDYNQDDRFLDFKKNVSYLPEEPLLLPELTVMQHFQMYAMSYEIKESIFNERCKSFVQSFELKHKMQAFPEELSKGMRQKVQTICTLLPDVPLLLIDEPFMGLDIYALDYLIQTLKIKVKQGTSILLTTHQLEQVKDLADEFVLLEQGEIKEKGPIDHFNSITRGSPHV